MKNDKSSHSQVFFELVSGLRKREHFIVVTDKIEERELLEICDFAIQNTPELFDVSQFHIDISPFQNKIVPEYSMQSGVAKAKLLRCKEQRAAILTACKRGNQYNSALAVHDYLVQNVSYGDNGIESHNILGPLLAHTGVCEGYAKTFKYLLEGLGIKSYVINGEAINAQSNLRGSHAWNIVNISNIWTYVDVTFDATMSGELGIRHDYFCLPEKMILNDHIFDPGEYPRVFDNCLEYYSMNNLLISGETQFLQLLTDYIQSDEKAVSFRAKDIAIESDLSEKILQLTLDFLKQNKINGTVNINVNPFQSVCSLEVKRAPFLTISKM